MTSDKLIFSIVQVRIYDQVKGSGCLLAGGYVITAYHVVKEHTPAFYICDDNACFTELLPVKPAAVCVLPKEEGDLLIYEIEQPEKYTDRYLELALEKEILHGHRFQTFGFPRGNTLNGNPYNRARVDDIFSANDYSIRKLTFSDPGNISKGYSGGPVYIPGYGVIGVITQKWEAISIGLPASVIADQFPTLAPKERFFPDESIGKYRCLVVHRRADSQAVDFFQKQVSNALRQTGEDGLKLKEKLFLKRFHLDHETIDLAKATAESDCTCIWIDDEADLDRIEQAVSIFTQHTHFIFNYGLRDKSLLTGFLENTYPATPCFPLDFHIFKLLKFERAHAFDLLEHSPFYEHSLSNLYSLFFEFLKKEYLQYDAQLKQLLLNFDFTLARAAIKSACLESKPFTFHCLEGSPGCGLPVLAHHGKQIIADHQPAGPVQLLQKLDWEINAPPSMEALTADFPFNPDDWFGNDGKQLIILHHFITPDLSAATIEHRTTLLQDFILHCGRVSSPAAWKGKLHFFIMNTYAAAYPLAARLSANENCHITTARVIDLATDTEPIDQLEIRLENPGTLPARLRQEIADKLPATVQDCTLVGDFLQDLCSRLQASHLYYNELTRI